MTGKKLYIEGIIGTVKFPYSCDLDHGEVVDDDGVNVLDDLLEDFKDLKVRITNVSTLTRLQIKDSESVDEMRVWPGLWTLTSSATSR